MKQPIYQRIADDLRNRIRSGDWKPGIMLPSRAELAKEYGVALMTMQKAVQPLIDEGLLVASNRRGTFVADKIFTVHDSPPPEMVEQVVLNVDEGNSQSLAPTLGVIGVFRMDTDDPLAWANQDSWHSKIVRALNAQLEDLGGRMQLFNLHDYDEPTFDEAVGASIDKAIRSGVDCLAFVDPHTGLNFPAYVPALIDQRTLPYVIVSGSSLDEPVPKVCIDERQAGQLAAAHLLEAGYRQILCLPLYGLHWEKLRFEGARQQAGSALHLPAEDDLASLREAYGTMSVQTTSEYAQLHADIADRTIGFDTMEKGEWALLMPNDPTAVPLHSCLQQRGMTPGRDIGLIGFDDHPYASLIGLSSVGQPLDLIGRTTARILHQAVRDDLDMLQARVRCRLVVRASTRR